MKPLLLAILSLLLLGPSPASAGIEAVGTRQALPPDLELTLTGHTYLPSHDLEIHTRAGQTGKYLDVMLRERHGKSTMNVGVATFKAKSLTLENVAVVDAGGKLVVEAERAVLHLRK